MASLARVGRVGIALSAGSARGIAHIGVLKVLTEAGVPIDCIAGTSAGAVIGGIYAATLNLNLMERLACHIKWDILVDLCVPRLGLVSGEKIKEFLRLLTHDKTFAELAIPFAAVACDLEEGTEVVLREGPVAEAIRASISIPGIAVPVRLGGRLLVDGAVLNRVPVNAVRAMGADYVIACNLTGRAGRARVRVENIFDVITTAIELMEMEILKGKIVEADIVISPDVGDIGPTRLDMAPELIKRGEEATREALPRILEEIGVNEPS
ncbi:MAG TPA: patatin family protein [Firmicutes bacterium]|nr:patatin family protein [Bacillota bacterium]